MPPNTHVHRSQIALEGTHGFNVTLVCAGGGAWRHGQASAPLMGQ